MSTFHKHGIEQKKPDTKERMVCGSICAQVRGRPRWPVGLEFRTEVQSVVREGVPNGLLGAGKALFYVALLTQTR